MPTSPPAADVAVRWPSSFGAIAGFDLTGRDARHTDRAVELAEAMQSACLSVLQMSREAAQLAGSRVVAAQAAHRAADARATAAEGAVASMEARAVEMNARTISRSDAERAARMRDAAALEAQRSQIAALEAAASASAACIGELRARVETLEHALSEARSRAEAAASGAVSDAASERTARLTAEQELASARAAAASEAGALRAALGEATTKLAAQQNAMHSLATLSAGAFHPLPESFPVRHDASPPSRTGDATTRDTGAAVDSTTGSGMHFDSADAGGFSRIFGPVRQVFAMSALRALSEPLDFTSGGSHVADGRGPAGWAAATYTKRETQQRPALRGVRVPRSR